MFQWAHLVLGVEACRAGQGVGTRRGAGLRDPGVTATALVPITPVFLVYAVLMVMGSWIIPLVTSLLGGAASELAASGETA